MNELVVVDDKKVMELFSSDGLEPIVLAVKEKVKDFVPDLTTDKGRKEIASLARKVAKTKVYLDERGKELVSEWKMKSKVVDKERSRVRIALDGIRDEVRKPLSDWEDAEKNRLKNLVEMVVAIEDLGKITDEWYQPLGLEALQVKLDKLQGIVVDESYTEYEGRAKTGQAQGLEVLTKAIERATTLQAEKEELEKLKREKALRDQKDFEERLKRQAAEEAKIEAERLAEREKAKVERDKKELEFKIAEQKRLAEESKLQAELAKAQVEIDKKAHEEALKQAEAKAKEDAKIAQEKAVEAEKLRVESIDMERIKKEAQRLANKKHVQSINELAASDLVKLLNIGPDQASSVIALISNNKISNVTINY